MERIKQKAQEEHEARKAQIIQRGELIEQMMKHPGWAYVDYFIKEHRSPKRLVIKEPFAPQASIQIQAHVSGQIDVLDKLMNYLNGSVKRKNKLAQTERGTHPPYNRDKVEEE